MYYLPHFPLVGPIFPLVGMGMCCEGQEEGRKAQEAHDDNCALCATSVRGDLVTLDDETTKGDRSHSPGTDKHETQVNLLVLHF